MPFAAQAATFTVSYSAYYASPSDAITTTATLTTDNGSFYGNGEYLVIAISGTRGGQTINGLADDFSGIFYPAKRPDSSYSFNTYVDNGGFSFSVGGVSYQVYRYSSDTAFYHEFSSASVGRLITPASFTVTPVAAAVPKPATWAMMIAGFGFAGASLRGRRRRVAFASA